MEGEREGEAWPDSELRVWACGGSLLQGGCEKPTPDSWCLGLWLSVALPVFSLIATHHEQSAFLDRGLTRGKGREFRGMHMHPGWGRSTECGWLGTGFSV